MFLVFCKCYFILYNKNRIKIENENECNQMFSLTNSFYIKVDENNDAVGNESHGNDPSLGNDKASIGECRKEMTVHAVMNLKKKTDWVFHKHIVLILIFKTIPTKRKPFLSTKAMMENSKHFLTISVMLRYNLKSTRSLKTIFQSWETMHP